MGWRSATPQSRGGVRNGPGSSSHQAEAALLLPSLSSLLCREEHATLCYDSAECPLSLLVQSGPIARANLMSASPWPR
jgi:hypothetical protein